MTNDELAGLAAQGLGMARTAYNQGKLNFVLALYHEGELKRMEGVEKIIIDRLGANWLNNGAAKDAGFNVLREACAIMPPDAAVFVTTMNRFVAAEKLYALPEAEREKHLDRGHDHHHEMVKQGLLELHDSFTAVAQTPEAVCIYTQDVNHGEPDGKPEIHFYPQSNFSGRLKMFGAEADQFDFTKKKPQ